MSMYIVSHMIYDYMKNKYLYTLTNILEKSSLIQIICIRSFSNFLHKLCININLDYK